MSTQIKFKYIRANLQNRVKKNTSNYVKLCKTQNLTSCYQIRIERICIGQWIAKNPSYATILLLLKVLKIKHLKLLVYWLSLEGSYYPNYPILMYFFSFQLNIYIFNIYIFSFQLLVKTETTHWIYDDNYSHWASSSERWLGLDLFCVIL